MRRVLIGLLTTVALVGAGTLAATPAEAAPKPVRITNSAKAWIGWNGTAKVAPKIKKVKGVSVKKKVLTVKQGSKTIGTNRKSVSLRPGTYRVSVKVTYKYKGKTRTTSRKLTVTVKQGQCATNANFASVVTSTTQGAGDTSGVISSKMHQDSMFVSMFLGILGLSVGNKTLPEWRELFEDPALQLSRAELAKEQGHIDDLIAVYGETVKYDIGLYEICGNSNKGVSMEYIGANAISKVVE